MKQVVQALEKLKGDVQGIKADVKKDNALNAEQSVLTDHLEFLSGSLEGALGRAKMCEEILDKKGKAK